MGSVRPVRPEPACCCSGHQTSRLGPQRGLAAPSTGRSRGWGRNRVRTWRTSTPRRPIRQVSAVESEDARLGGTEGGGIREDEGEKRGRFSCQVPWAAVLVLSQAPSTHPLLPAHLRQSRKQHRQAHISEIKVGWFANCLISNDRPTIALLHRRF